MKVFLLLGLSACVSAAPRKQKEDALVIIRCMAENFGNEKKILSCRNCFKAVGDYMSAGGLPMAQSCAREFWPESSLACADEIAKMKVGDYDQGDVVLDCIDDALDKSNAERCMKETTSNDVREKLTEGSLCILEYHRFAWSFVKNNTGGHTGERKVRKQGGWGQRKDNMGLKKQMMKMMSMAHCDVSIEEGEERNGECKSCFTGAAGTIDIGKTGALAACSEQYLAPLYDHCTAMVRDATKEKKEVFGCYNKVLVGSIVADCVDDEGVTVADADNLVKVTDCSEDVIAEWVMDHAEPEVAEKLGHFLGMEDD